MKRMTTKTEYTQHVHNATSTHKIWAFNEKKREKERGQTWQVRNQRQRQRQWWWWQKGGHNSTHCAEGVGVVEQSKLPLDLMPVCVSHLQRLDSPFGGRVQLQVARALPQVAFLARDPRVSAAEARGKQRVQHQLLSRVKPEGVGLGCRFQGFGGLVSGCRFRVSGFWGFGFRV